MKQLPYKGETGLELHVRPCTFHSTAKTSACVLSRNSKTVLTNRFFTPRYINSLDR